MVGIEIDDYGHAKLHGCAEARFEGDCETSSGREAHDVVDTISLNSGTDPVGEVAGSAASLSWQGIWTIDFIRQGSPVDQFGVLMGGTRPIARHLQGCGPA